MSEVMRVWPHVEADGAAHMALDEAAMEAAREGHFVFRTYGWDPPCRSFGRNQPTGPRPDLGLSLECGVDVVRRPTGGRSVYHGPELTYAFIAPDRSLGGPRATYRDVHAALAAALKRLGVRLDPDPRPRTDDGPALALDASGCFVVPAPGEITAGGRKLVGSAQWRHRGAILQHGSILLRNEQGRATVAGEGGRGAVGLDELGVRVSAREVRERFAEQLESVIGRPAVPAAVPRKILDLAAALEVRYRSSEWTWRR